MHLAERHAYTVRDAYAAAFSRAAIRSFSCHIFASCLVGANKPIAIFSEIRILRIRALERTPANIAVGIEIGSREPTRNVGTALW